MKLINRIIGATFALLAVGAVMDGLFNSGITIREAVAVPGRPLTPRSAAGVSRRTTRRVIRRTSVYAATLPKGCSTVVVEGVSLHQCGGTYYQPYGDQYVVVEVD